MNDLTPTLPSGQEDLRPNGEVDDDYEYDESDEGDEDDAESISYPPVYHSLMVMGLLGSVYGVHEQADIIDLALRPTLFDPIAYMLQRAMAQSLGGQGEAAAATLKAHLEMFPQHDGAKVVLAISLIMARDPSWLQVIENVLASSSDPQAREAATNLISYLRSRR